MGAANIAAWKRQNSDPVLVEVLLAEGTLLKGTILVQRERTLKDVLGGTEPFIEFECSVSGEMVIGKGAVAMVRPCRPLQADHLERRQKMLEQSEAHGVLKVAKGADRDRVREAYLTLQRQYHPDRYAGVELPPEMRDYLNAMTRRINAAYSELNLLMGVANEAGMAA
jgi:hypothetical protein